MNILPLLLVAQGTVGAGDHAALHPSDATFFVQVPDLQRLTSAYPDAPLFQLLDDPELAALAAKIAGGDPETFRLTDFVHEKAYESLDTFPTQVQQAIDLVTEARAFSFSVAAPELAGLIQAAANAGSEEQVVAAVANKIGALCVMEFSTPEAARAAADMIGSVPGTRVVEELEPAALEIAGVPASVTRLEVEEFGEALPYWTLTVDGTLALGVGATTPAALARRLDDPTLSLKGTSRFSDGVAGFLPAEGVTVFEAFVHLDNLSDLIDAATWEIPGPERAMISGVAKKFFAGDSLTSHSRMRLSGGRFISEALTSDGDPDESLFGFIGRDPVDAEAMALVPPDAVAAWVTNVDPDALLERAMNLAATFTGADPGQLLADLDQTYGLRPAEDLFSSLGSRTAIYVLPISGLTLPKVHAQIELRDPEAFQRGLEGLAKFAEGASGGEVRVETRPYRKYPLYTFAPKRSIGELAGDVGAPSEFVNIAPGILDPEFSIAVIGDRALIGLSAMNVKREIKRLAKQTEPSAQHALLGRELPADASSVSFVDWGSILGGFYTTVRTFMPMIAQAVPDMPFSPEDLPEPGLFSRYFQPSVTWTRSVEGGIYEYSESPFGPEIPVALLAGAGAALWLSVGQVAPSDDFELIEVSPPEPVPDTGRERTVDALRELKLALAMYRTDAGALPERLEQLIEPRADFPQGFVDGGVLPNDGWGRAFLYARGADEADYELWSTGPDGVDQRSGGDDVALD